jgi:hypothetical protein
MIQICRSGLYSQCDAKDTLPLQNGVLCVAALVGVDLFQMENTAKKLEYVRKL